LAWSGESQSPDVAALGSTKISQLAKSSEPILIFSPTWQSGRKPVRCAGRWNCQRIVETGRQFGPLEFVPAELEAASRKR
jgi:hypothetical protein